MVNNNAFLSVHPRPSATIQTDTLECGAPCWPREQTATTSTTTTTTITATQFQSKSCTQVPRRV